MPTRVPLAKKSVNLFFNDERVIASRESCDTPSVQVAEMLPEQQRRTQHRAQAYQSVACWNALHDVQGSFADAHSLL